MPTTIDKYLNPAGLDETVLNIRQIAEGLEAEMQELPYARPDGLYSDMTVGAVIGADETAQWATRESTGSGAATVRSVQGATVVWNQLVNGVDRNATAYGLTMVYANGKVTLSGVAVATNNFWLTNTNISVVKDHKYLVIGGSTVARVYINADGIGSVYDPSIVTASQTNTTRALLCFVAAADLTIPYECYPQIFDLTAMFGTGNEPTTVAEFEAMFPEAYYPYSEPTLKPVTIAGIESTDANGDALDGVEWESYTLRAAGSVADMLYSDHVDVKVGVVDLGTLTWKKYNSSGDVPYYFATDIVGIAQGVAYLQPSNLACARYTVVAANWDINVGDKQICKGIGATGVVVIKDSAYAEVADFKAAMSGVYLFYELATPTTTPISPALPMTYRVQQGGTESIIVPDGEVSAAPVLTIAEPVNAGDEFARIWSAIQSLGYTRNTAQLSRPISLTDVGSIDEVQKDTTEIAENETVKEVQE